MRTSEQITPVIHYNNTKTLWKVQRRIATYVKKDDFVVTTKLFHKMVDFKIDSAAYC